MSQLRAFESKFQKFYVIRIIQICESKTLKVGFKEIRAYSNKQSTITKYRNRKSMEQVYQGETYISTKQYLQILAQFPKLTQNIKLSDHFKKKLGSNPQIQATVKETVSLIMEKQRQQEQEIRTKQVIQNFLNHRSIRGIEQQTNKSASSIVIKQSNTDMKFSINMVLTILLVLFFLYQASGCESFLL
ncbi:unnamed protein product (macronuclear) [Paramecium tetraurelia]|uniref:Transmembrane protein n=1 Tax=Paramecium tetraurelia TaxID=5888 RepID=A0BMB9_PARTE|nr:uncharacterized protein GSPATT00030322001 [Paramecium tetraurelia]CAK59686.1 unnamed protein product [Paramecium tetraurelia]|eukprot:XP_001427084.1 hypothetical protein (macronuclear) [Paramecium tetraurelia strain d4-2]